MERQGIGLWRLRVQTAWDHEAQMDDVTIRFYERSTGLAIDDLVPEAVSPLIVAEVMFEIVQAIEQAYPGIGHEVLDRSLDDAANAVIERVAEDGWRQSLDPLPVSLRRAVFARVTALVTLGMLNDKSGTEALTVLPQGLPEDLRAIAFLVDLGRHPDLLSMLR